MTRFPVVWLKYRRAREGLSRDATRQWRVVVPFHPPAKANGPPFIRIKQCCHLGSDQHIPPQAGARFDMCAPQHLECKLSRRLVWCVPNFSPSRRHSQARHILSRDLQFCQSFVPVDSDRSPRIVSRIPRRCARSLGVLVSIYYFRGILQY